MLSPLRPLRPNETVLQVTVSQDSTVIATMSAGATLSMTVPLTPRHTYNVALLLQTVVPHGVDPNFDVDYSAVAGGPSVVPTPLRWGAAGLSALLLIAACASGAVYVRRRSAASSTCIGERTAV